MLDEVSQSKVAGLLFQKGLSDPVSVMRLYPQAALENVQSTAADGAAFGTSLGAEHIRLFLGATDQQGCARGIHNDIR